MGLAHPEHHGQEHALAGLGEPPRDQDALLRDVTADGENYSAVVKKPVDIVTLLKVVAQKTGNEYKLDIFKDAAWHAPAAK